MKNEKLKTDYWQVVFSASVVGGLHTKDYSKEFIDRIISSILIQ